MFDSRLDPYSTFTLGLVFQLSTRKCIINLSGEQVNYVERLFVRMHLVAFFILSLFGPRVRRVLISLTHRPAVVFR